MMKYYKIFILLIIFLLLDMNAQQQTRIPWPSLADSPWPALRGDAQGTKRSEYVGPKTQNIIWQKTYPTGIVNGPIFDENGKLYFGSREAAFSDSVNNFYCVDSSGNEIWRFHTISFLATNSAPFIDSSGVIYLGSQNDNFYALNPDGSLKWKHNSSSGFMSRNLVPDKEGNIYIANQDSLFCFRPDGSIKYKKAFGDDFMTLDVFLVFSPEGDRFYTTHVDAYNYFMLAIDLNGNIIWEKEFSELTPYSIVVDNSGKLYAMGKETDSTDRGIFCLNRDGEVLWFSNYYEANTYGSPTIDPDGNIIYPVYEGIASIDNQGNPSWIHNFEIDDYYGDLNYEEVLHSLISDAEGTIYAGSSVGNYFHVISNDGELLWRIPLEGQFCDAPAAIGKDGTLYFGLSWGFDKEPVINNLVAVRDKPNSVEKDELPSVFTLEQNYPNPFNPSTTIKFGLPVSADVNVTVYNVLGQVVEVLADERMNAGTYSVSFDSENTLSSGIYFYRINAQGIDGKNFVDTKKMILIK